MKSIHKPVLLEEVLQLLEIKEGMVAVDATLGGGGHSRKILESVGKKGVLISIDLDSEAIFRFADSLSGGFSSLESFGLSILKKENIFLVNGNFSDLDEILQSIEISKVDVILADLGWSSDQLSGRGMSFLKDEKLDMRFSQKSPLNAEKVVNEYSESDLSAIVRDLGEERFWKNIVRGIVEVRKLKRIETTIELAEIIRERIPKRYVRPGIDPATRTFQAIRMEVNSELANLEKFLARSISILGSGGKLATISFHSLEDRMVKNLFRQKSQGCVCPKDFPQCVCEKLPEVEVITKKPIVSSLEEIEKNPRARSAKLRVCRKI